MNFESSNKPQLSVSEAIAQVLSIKAQIEVMGANDSEAGEIARILEAVHQGAITPEEAVRHAQGIQDGKQDYH